MHTDLARDETPPSVGREAFGWAIFAATLALLGEMLPLSVFTPSAADYLLVIGAVALWRYSLGLLHFTRAMLFLHFIFPAARRQATALGAAGEPSHAYLLVTSFRIQTHISTQVYRAVFAEAARFGAKATVVASIVEMADERMIRLLWDKAGGCNGATLRIVRIPGTGKRDALVQGFRVIARDEPDSRAVVAVVDGDTVLRPGTLEKCAPFLAMYPSLGGLTTNEFCRVDGGPVITQWHKMRFAQRNLNMCSMALTRRVLTLTGRMSMFRATVVTDPGFIEDVGADHLDHWRLGRFRFLTGDDKSSWYSLMRLGWDTWYVPDAAIDTLESPPSESFWHATRQLMFRWYGNSLRQNSRAVGLGPRRLGPFCFYVLLDQRVQMWTSLLGLSAAIVGFFKYGWPVLGAYLVWIGVSRLWMTLLLCFSEGHRPHPSWPLLLYYNQIIGSITKIYAYFFMDRQSWTRQKTVLNRGLSTWQTTFNLWSSRAMTFAAASVFAALILRLV